MSKKWMLALALSATVGLAACGSDDDDGTGPQQDEIVGTWVSAGANVAPGLKALAGIDSVIAVFNVNQTYTVRQYSSTLGSLPNLSGTWAASTGARGSIRSITLTQTAPTGLTAEGIFQVAGNTMRYEVIQTTPFVGAQAPTITGGFGSSVQQGQRTNIWIQNYVRR